MAGKPFQSKLRPFVGLIRQWRLGRKTYREIARLLHEEHGVSVDHTTIISFVKRRARRRKLVAGIDYTLPPLPQGTVSTLQPQAPDSMSAIERLKRKPKPEPAAIVFDYNETKPLTYIPKGNTTP